MKNKPKVGDMVHLNLHGIEMIHGHTDGLYILTTQSMKITWVDDESITYPEDTWIVNVDNPEVNMFFIDNWCFDPF